MSELIYPTLDLFLYDLRDAFNTTEEEKRKNLENFQAKLPQDIQLVDSDIETEYLELLPQQKTYDFISEDKLLSGYYLPVRLNDTYGLQIDCSINNQTEPQLTDCIKLIKTEIEQRLNGKTATLGQTWMVSGWLPEVSINPPEKIAQDCYKVLVQNSNWQQDLKGEGVFFGGHIFELWRYQMFIEENIHVIIILFPNRNSAEKAADFHTDWMGLFCYWSKIVWAYNQSRLLKKFLVNDSKRIENYIRDNQGNDFDFSQIQLILQDYSISLPQLKFQEQIIDINLLNYQTRLEIIQQKAGQENNLDFLNKFSKLAHKKYLQQIAKDYELMELGLRLLETNINAVRSQVEIEKARRDRIFQTIVTIVGAGTAFAALIDDEAKKCKAVVKLLPSNNDPNKSSSIPDCNNPWVGSVGFPIVLLIVLGLIFLGAKKIIFEVVLRQKNTHKKG